MNPEDIEHRLVSAHHDEDWTAHCACGFAAYAYLRPDAEAKVAKHIAEEGIAASRAALEEGQGE